MTEPSLDPKEAKPVRVFVVDDHPAFLETVAIVIDASPGFVVVGTATSGEEALLALADEDNCHPDLLLLDFSLPGLTGAMTAQCYVARGGTALPILMSTMPEDHLPDDALASGRFGFLPKAMFSTKELEDRWVAAVERSRPEQANNRQHL